MSKILFFDVDGTLYNEQKQLPRSAKEALMKARANGYELAIATGRAPFMIESLLEELQIDTYVTFNGQYVVYKGELVFTDGITLEQLEDIIAFGESRNEPVVFLDASRMIATAPHHTRVAESLQTLKYPYPAVDALYYKAKPVYQTLAFIDEDGEALYREYFPNVQFVRWHPYSCDILPKNGSKARGIAKLLQKMGLTAEDAIAFGDGLNDVEMLKYVGTGVAMGNGHIAAKEAADYVTDDVNKDGLMKAMQHFKLI